LKAVGKIPLHKLTIRIEVITFFFTYQTIFSVKNSYAINNSISDLTPSQQIKQRNLLTINQNNAAIQTIVSCWENSNKVKYAIL